MLKVVLRLSRRIASRGLLLPVLLIALADCTAIPASAHEVTQISTYPALEKGWKVYDSTASRQLPAKLR